MGFQFGCRRKEKLNSGRVGRTDYEKDGIRRGQEQ